MHFIPYSANTALTLAEIHWPDSSRVNRPGYSKLNVNSLMAKGVDWVEAGGTAGRGVAEDDTDGR